MKVFRVCEGDDEHLMALEGASTSRTKIEAVGLRSQMQHDIMKKTTSNENLLHESTQKDYLRIDSMPCWSF